MAVSTFRHTNGTVTTTLTASVIGCVSVLCINLKSVRYRVSLGSRMQIVIFVILVIFIGLYNGSRGVSSLVVTNSRSFDLVVVEKFVVGL